MLQKGLADGYQLAAFETTRGATEIYTSELKQPLMFIFGNEKFGIDEDVLQMCHQIVRIPLLGSKNSLNVSNAAAIALYEATRQNL